jgi:UPF0271 protein
VAYIDLNADLGEDFGVWQLGDDDADPAAIAHRVATMVTTGEVTAIDGAQIAVSVESVPLHGDSPGTVRHQLKAASIEIRALC